MSTTTTYVDRLEHELLGAIGRRRRKRTVLAGLATMFAVTAAVVGAVVLTGNGSSPALAVDIRGGSSPCWPPTSGAEPWRPPRWSPSW